MKSPQVTFAWGQRRGAGKEEDGMKKIKNISLKDLEIYRGSGIRKSLFGSHGITWMSSSRKEIARAKCARNIRYTRHWVKACVLRRNLVHREPLGPWEMEPERRRVEHWLVLFWYGPLLSPHASFRKSEANGILCISIEQAFSCQKSSLLFEISGSCTTHIC